MHMSAAIWDVPRRQKHTSAAIPDVPRSRRHVSANLLDAKSGQKQTAAGWVVIFAQIGGGTSDYLVVRRQALSATPPSPGLQRRKPPSTRDCGGGNHTRPYHNAAIKRRCGAYRLPRYAHPCGAAYRQAVSASLRLPPHYKVAPRPLSPKDVPFLISACESSPRL